MLLTLFYTAFNDNSFLDNEPIYVALPKVR